jgi:adenylylsulfate kinase-like enzyme
MESTQTEVLEKIRIWVRDKNGPPVCWLHDLAGSGKSTIAQEYDRNEPGKKLSFSY